MEHHFTGIAADVTSNLVRAEAPGDLFRQEVFIEVIVLFYHSIL